MTTDAPANPPPDTPGSLPPAGPDGAGTPPKPRRPLPRRRRRPWKTVVWAGTVPVVLVALAAGVLYGALTTERGTAYAWRTAVTLLDGRLTGTLDGGTIATGLRLHQVAWRSLDGRGTDIKIDRIAGRWALSDKPWRFAVDYLHIGTVDARIAPSPSSSAPMELPQDLELPMQLEVRDLRVDRLLLRQGGS